ncbi:hypothetical protein NSZ01_32020 [Nocardioides szechwanensis]|nr:hypothetical protein [Nocardioides szechwanensis]GEP35434.1 hypothetical protein NSZ01_32020 [Nocardioides szechwanensis]
MSLVLPWVLPVLFVAGVGAFVALDGDGRDGAAEPVPSNGMGHIHGLGVADQGQTIYIGAHTGFFRASAGEPTERVGDTWQDTMAFLRVSEGDFLASGHPDLTSDLPTHLGLVGSTDQGRTWELLSLAGEADFHALESAGRWVVGYDSHGERILASKDRQTWTTIDDGPMLDVAVAPVNTAAKLDQGELGAFLATTATGEVVRYPGASGQPRPLTTAPTLALLDWPTPELLVGVDPQGTVYLSRTGGRDWESRGSIGGSPGALEVTANAWYAATATNVVVSLDQGQTWSVIA